MRFLFFLLSACALLLGADSGYVGAQVCSGCHRDIAASQSKTNMARTWHGAATSQLPAEYVKEHAEGGVRYRIARTADGFEFKVALPGRPEPRRGVWGARSRPPMSNDRAMSGPPISISWTVPALPTR